MMPCAGFLTDSSVRLGRQFPSGMDGAAICYCRVANGDVQQLLPAPMNFTQMFSFTDECRIELSLRKLAKYCGGKSYIILIKFLP
jgi:hypothetical protein